MPTLLTDIPNVQPPLIPHRKRWTREQCAPLEAAGVFEREKLELVDGELISKMGKNRPHVNCFRLMQYWLLDVFGRPFVYAEAPIDVDAADNALNEPQPDLIVLNRECRAFTAGNPQPQDIRLLVEISDSALNYDLNVKGPLYARAGLVEYWVVDISARRLVVHRNPDAGRYASVVSYSEPEPVAPLAAPGAFFCVSEALLA
jgi:Uma2 family endonuclease